MTILSLCCAAVTCLQFMAEDAPYDASIPVHKAFGYEKDVLLALEMNGQ